MGATTCKNCGSLNMLCKPCSLCKHPPTPTYIQLPDYLKHAENPLYKSYCTPEIRDNAVQLLAVVNDLLMELIKRGVIAALPVMTSGWRPIPYNKQIGGAANSKHTIALAIDLLDLDRSLGNYLVAHQELLKERGLAIEALASTVKPQPWVHIQLGLPLSGKNVFIP